jgi:hypothetical protein
LLISTPERSNYFLNFIEAAGYLLIIFAPRWSRSSTDRIEVS